MSTRALERFRYLLTGTIMSYVGSNTGLPLKVMRKGLMAATVVGLGLYTYSALFSGSEEQAVQTEVVQLRQRVEAVTAERDQFARERDQMIQAGQDLKGVQNQVEDAMQELR